jgi:hypothetical protein
MAQYKFGTYRRIMLSFERQPFPGPCHVDQDVAHSRAWRALGHLTTLDRVLPALHRRNHLPLPPDLASVQCYHGHQGVLSNVSRPVSHFAYPCERNQALRRAPASHSSTSSLLFNPLMYWVSVPGRSATYAGRPLQSAVFEGHGESFSCPQYVAVRHLMHPEGIALGTPTHRKPRIRTPS